MEFTLPANFSLTLFRIFKQVKLKIAFININFHNSSMPHNNAYVVNRFKKRRFKSLKPPVHGAVFVYLGGLGGVSASELASSCYVRGPSFRYQLECLSLFYWSPRESNVTRSRTSRSLITASRSRVKPSSETYMKFFYFYINIPFKPFSCVFYRHPLDCRFFYDQSPTP